MESIVKVYNLLFSVILYFLKECPQLRKGSLPRHFKRIQIEELR